MKKNLPSKKIAEQHTEKKVKYVGTEQWLNPKTGVLEEFHVTSIEERDFNFSKVWMKNFIMTLDMVGNQKTRLALWIIDNLNKENQLIATCRSIAESTDISLKTVSTTMKILQDSNFLQRTGNGVYTVNPDIYFKGTRNARLNVLNQYQELGAKRPQVSDQEKIKMLENSISTLQKELTKLKSNSNVIDTEVQPAMEIIGNEVHLVERATEIKKGIKK